MVIFYDKENGKDKPISLVSFLVSGEYDQGDMALVAYDDVYNLLHDASFRQEIAERVKKALTPSQK